MYWLVVFVLQTLLGSTGVGAIYKMAVLRHPAKEFMEAFADLNYGQRFAEHFGMSEPVSLAEVLN